MSSIALIVNRSRPRAAALAREAAAWLTTREHDVRIPQSDAESVGLREHACRDEKLVPGLDLAVSLGGDGTVLRSVHLVARHAVPVLGVNLGHLGYLADVEPDGVADALARFLAGSYSVEERMMLSVTIERAASGVALAETHLALNEAVVEKQTAGQVAHVAVTVDGRSLNNYRADGIIVATPTGSTAYAFSARGPIIWPLHRSLLLTPVSPHQPFDRSHVFDPGQTLRLEVAAHRPATLIIDGRELGLLAGGDTVTCTASPTNARFVVFGQRDFYGTLKAKFGLSGN
ncbi:MAG TPA: NAD(+)/NADH kinase [Acidimicrobiales bacterium]|nr:NAD(+)/NADH kinase [Acidimicrobiales bacterium]